MIILFKVMWLIINMNRTIRSSKTYQISKRLVIDGDKNYFENSKLLRLFTKIDRPKLSLVFLVLSILCFWYEGFFSQVGFGFISAYNLASVFLLLGLFFCDKKRLKTTRATMYLLAFILTLVISGLWASINGLELGMLIKGILLFLHFVLAYFVASTYKRKNIVIDILIALALPLIVVGLFQGFLGEATSKLWVSTGETLIDSRSFGFFGSPNVMGGVMMIVAIASFFRLLDSKKIRYLSPFILSVIVMITTYSRSAWIGFGVGILSALIIKNWRFVAILPVGLLGLLIPSVRQRLLVALSQSYVVDSALDGRIWATNNAIEIFKTSPLVGTGPGSYGGETAIFYNSPVYLRGTQNGYVALAYTDNQWAQLLAQTGFIGILSLAGFFISYFVNGLRQYKQSGKLLTLGCLAVLVSLLVAGIFENILEFGAVSVLAGVYLGLGNSYEE